MEDPENISNTSNTFVDTHRTEYDRDGSRLAYLTVEVGIAVSGLLANIVVIATILSCKRLRSVNYHLILNLCFSDIGILLFTFSFGVNIQERGSWPKFVCLYLLPLSDMFQGVSYWTITAIAISRYRTVLGNFSVGVNTLKKTKCVIVCIWLISFLVVSVPAIPYMEHIETPAGGFCRLDFPQIEGHDKQFLNMIYSFTIRLTLTYALPMAVIATTYISLSIHLSKVSRQLRCMMGERRFTERSLTGVQIRSALERNRRAKKLLTPLVLVFAITGFPLNLLRVWQYFGLDVVPYHTRIAVIVSLVFFISHCAINPVIYCIVNPDFYREMKMCLRKFVLIMRVLYRRLFSKTSRPNLELEQLNSSLR